MHTQPASATPGYTPHPHSTSNFTSNVTAIALAALTTVVATVVLGDLAFGLVAGTAVAFIALSIINGSNIGHYLPTYHCYTATPHYNHCRPVYTGGPSPFGIPHPTIYYGGNTYMPPRYGQGSMGRREAACSPPPGSRYMLPAGGDGRGRPPGWRG